MDLKTPRRWFFDFDHTLYDTEAFYELVRNDLIAAGSQPDEIDAAREALAADVGYSFEGHMEFLGYPPDFVSRKAEEFKRHQLRGNEFLFPNALKVLREISATDECNLLTFGNPTFQRAKYAGISNLHTLIGDAFFVWRDRSKGDVLRDAGKGTVTFIDDTPRQLLDAREKAPWVTRIRMMWPQAKRKPHPGDGELWRVIRSLDEL